MSPEPVIGIVGQQLYDAVRPITVYDESHDYVMKYLCEALGRQFEVVATYAYDRSETEPGWSILMDVDVCPPEALAWLGQFVGVRFIAGLSEADQRLKVKSTDGFNRGTVAAIRTNVQRFLTGDKVVIIYERADPIDYPTDHAYRLVVHTYDSETPDAPAVIAAIIEQKPAGIILEYSSVLGQDYNQLVLNHPTYDDVLNDYADYNAVLTDTP